MNCMYVRRKELMLLRLFFKLQQEELKILLNKNYPFVLSKEFTYGHVFTLSPTTKNNQFFFGSFVDVNWLLYLIRR